MEPILFTVSVTGYTQRIDFLVAVVNESPVLVHLYGVSDYTVDNMSSILISESRANKESVRGKHLKLFTDN